MEAHGGGVLGFILHLVKDIPIDVVLIAFFSCVTYTVMCYVRTSRQLQIMQGFLSKFRKEDLNFRFREIDEWMTLNPYVSHVWLEFRNTLVFSESVALKGQNNDLTYKEVSSTVQNIQTTVDPLYFFNEETLVNSKFNHKLIEQLPTILTGFGPLFTFLKIATAFGKIDFSSQEKTIKSVAGLMSDMQTAALVSVFAVSTSLLFIIIEKIAYAKTAKKVLNHVEELLGKLFNNISSEKFLLELLKETKIQNNSVSNLIVALPNNFKAALNSGIAANLVPYLENVIFGINQLNKTTKDAAKAATKGDIADELF
jgi:hypothetical protein